MVGVEGEHSKPLVPAEKGTEPGFTQWIHRVTGPPQNINNCQGQKGGGGGICV